MLRFLQSDFGDFPMPSLQILLIDWADGMEYYGATTTGSSSLSHELVHMYWGTSAVGRTWRDTWLDEAIVTWWEQTQLRGKHIAPIPRRYTSDMVSGRNAIEPAFDLSAYGKGARIVSALAERVGGEAALIELLAAIHRARAFAPFSTVDFIDDLVAATGDDSIRDSMKRWLFGKVKT
ncbi:MAG: hypothetical protein ACRDWD_16070 [Acidimicrobiia bacterium]